MTWDRQTSAAVSRSRRQFIRETTGACLGASFLPSHASAAQAQRRKAVIITFGGGARDDETFMPGGHENIPHLLKELLPQATSSRSSSIEGFSVTMSPTRAWRLTERSMNEALMEARTSALLFHRRPHAASSRRIRSI